uniref:Cyclase aurE n=1 Tax=Calcarisporium arbuscula TaxID=240499 RepID=AURE_CALAK|nr:RecName: Full=Cyclase aurE; AltName: Full=Aurovertin biosynthesis cluster protein E [Calcarisporium arbuscula]ALD83631.1 SnoaL-like protein [Calcarisporium arbuscula]
MSTSCSNPDDQVKARNDKFMAALNDATDIDLVMSFFSPDVSYSDFAFEAVNMDFTSTRDYMDKMFHAVDDLHLTQVSLTGDKDFTASEWVMTYKLKSSDKVGEVVKMRGVSLSWYDAQGLIVRNNDYSLKWSGDID